MPDKWSFIGRTPKQLLNTLRPLSLYPKTTNLQNAVYSMDLGMFKLDLQCLLDLEALQETGEKCEHSCTFARL